MVIELDVAGELVKHGAALDVITTVTISEFDNDVVVKVEAFSPRTSTPFTCH
jgi:hypothetical protein